MLVPRLRQSSLSCLVKVAAGWKGLERITASCGRAYVFEADGHEGTPDDFVSRDNLSKSSRTRTIRR